MKIRPQPAVPLTGLLLAGLVAIPTILQAGAFIFADETNGLNIVTHPPNYGGTGNGGVVAVRVCINPASPNATDMAIPVQNNINIYNRLQPTTGNLKLGGSNNIPATDIDFESVALHEIGHCLGMAHANAATESFPPPTGTEFQRNFTRATDGPNNVFDIDAGPDGISGSSDDIRDDDDNLHWFRKSNNNPFTIAATVDSSTYSRNLGDLPGGHSFAANADRTVGTLLGAVATEAVMQQGTYIDEAQRTLGHDDVATLRYAMSGINESAGSADDYSINLVYGGITTSNCDILLQITTTSGLAFCGVGGTYVGGSDHFSIINATIEFGNGYNWFFNPATNNQPPVLAAIGNPSVNEGASLAVAITASDADADNLAFSASGLPTFAVLTDHGNGTATLDINPGTGSAGSYPVTLNVIDDGLPALLDSEIFNVIVNAPSIDSDGDGISDADELLTGTNPNSVDSDGDGLADGLGGVVLLAALPGGIDFDGDGFVDGELDAGTNPLNADSDGDQLADGLEVAWNSNPLSAGSWPAIADGDLAPLGNPDGNVNTADYLIAMRIALGDLPGLPLQLAHGDLYPPGAPDDVIDLSDLLLLQQLILATP
ncbi:MAG TPA: hypothetical protein VM011_03145 [Gammaproteobacteria bacterium]|nr:hypothetical protein [Gammaproteobacteria bacterium]